MIVAAGLGTRLRPLTDLRPKPALPVRGIPLIGYQLALLRAHGVSEVVINLHHLADVLEEAARAHCPPGLTLCFSREETLLGTGGGLRRVAGFLAESDPCLVLGGDMLLDADLGELVARHRAHGDAVTMLLKQDARVATFGSVGADAEGRVRRIGSRLDLGGEVRAGVYVWANVVSRKALETLPQREVFGHLDHWIGPLLSAGARDIRAEFETGGADRWEPAGTLPEYLAANLDPMPTSYLDAAGRSRAGGTRIEGDLVLGAGATLGAGASLHRVVVWDGEHVPAGLAASDGIFAGGAFHPVARDPETEGEASG